MKKQDEINEKVSELEILQEQLMRNTAKDNKIKEMKAKLESFRDMDELNNR